MPSWTRRCDAITSDSTGPKDVRHIPTEVKLLPYLIKYAGESAHAPTDPQRGLGPTHARDVQYLWVPKTSSAGRINITTAGCDIQERAYATRV
jgi:hypothetical protein